MEGVLYLFAKGGTIVTEKPKKKKKDIYWFISCIMIKNWESMQRKLQKEKVFH